MPEIAKAISPAQQLIELRWFQSGWCQINTNNEDLKYRQVNQLIRFRGFRHNNSEKSPSMLLIRSVFLGFWGVAKSFRNGKCNEKTRNWITDNYRLATSRLLLGSLSSQCGTWASLPLKSKKQLNVYTELYFLIIIILFVLICKGKFST